MKKCSICNGYILHIDGTEVHTTNPEKIAEYSKEKDDVIEAKSSKINEKKV